MIVPELDPPLPAATAQSIPRLCTTASNSRVNESESYEDGALAPKEQLKTSE
jgi:hypothetical protein